MQPSNKKPRRSKPEKGKQKGDNRLRIIGGEWRGRRLEFALSEGLRPTGERIRETLFNWLMAETPGAHCLDLFAGSGALSFEALSRGAASVILVEKSKAVTQVIRTQIAALQDDRARLINADSLHWLENTSTGERQFDIVFLDPPFRKNLLEPCIKLLVDKAILKPGAMIYIESESELKNTNTPSSWSLHRQKSSGQVTYSLYINHGNSMDQGIAG